MAWITKASLATATETLITSYVQTATKVRAALDARFMQPSQVSGVVAAAIAADPAPAAAAASAVAGAMAGQNLSWSLIQGGPQVVTLSILRGAPAYAAGKIGTCMTGAALRFDSMAGNQPGDYTAEFWFKRAAVPGADSTLVKTPFGPIGMTTAGKVYWLNSAEAAGANLCDGVWHHVAVVIAAATAAGTTYLRRMGVWVDGVKIVASTATTNPVSTWADGLIIGGNLAAGADSLVASFDEVRLSYKANDFYTQAGTTGRYTGAGPFTPSVLPFDWDDDTLVLAHLDSSRVSTVKANGYPPRPVGAPSGAVTYIGALTPSSALTRDRWIQK